jgi:hypothetical protein
MDLGFGGDDGDDHPWKAAPAADVGESSRWCETGCEPPGFEAFGVVAANSLAGRDGGDADARSRFFEQAGVLAEQRKPAAGGGQIGKERRELVPIHARSVASFGPGVQRGFTVHGRERKLRDAGQGPVRRECRSWSSWSAT